MSLLWTIYLIMALISAIVWFAYAVYLGSGWKETMYDHVPAAIVCSMIWWIIWPAMIMVLIKQHWKQKMK